MFKKTVLEVITKVEDTNSVQKSLMMVKDGVVVIDNFGSYCARQCQVHFG